MSDSTADQIAQRLSLRAPQFDALNVLSDLITNSELQEETDLLQKLNVVNTLYPTCSDFERDFMSVCFALATGVGKTRLMGAFITYLYLKKDIRNFFVLAPNKTIYRKLIEDFGSPAHPKYVFKGIAEFTVDTPRIITGETYTTAGQLTFKDAPIRINVFNIQKINAESKGGKEPKIKRLSEYLGESYFEYLSGLTDLVLLMDESHHYRADRGMTVINELKPILGLELTATPQTETKSKTIKFKNVVFEYALSAAMKDGFVKEPFVATRSDFDPVNYTEDEIDTIKLEDGLRIHEQTKNSLEVFARNKGREIVKPFVLVVAKDTDHAARIREKIEDKSFFNGDFKDKIIEVHSNQRGEEKDENIAQLVRLENPDNNIEIVIHVNMLKEGWDVTNLYTIIPLRASASATLTEQTIGRGLRLPYGQRVGVSEVDRLTIVAHDKFQAIIEEANRDDSLIKQGNIIDINKLEDELAARVVVGSSPKAFANYENLKEMRSQESDPEVQAQLDSEIELSVLINERVLKLQNSQGMTSDLNSEENKKIICESIKGDSQTLFVDHDSEKRIEQLVEQATTYVQKYTIPIPRLSIQPSLESTISIEDFDLNTANLKLRPQSNDIKLQSLEDTKAKQVILQNSATSNLQESMSNVIVTELLDVEFLDYDENSQLLFKLAGQAIDNFRSYLTNEDDVENVVYTQKQRIADLIEAQIREHLVRSPVTYDLSATLPFTEIYEETYTLGKDESPRHYTETINSDEQIKKVIFTGFTKACHEKYKFDSKSEKDFAYLLEKDSSDFVERWLRPAPRQFNITWGSRRSKYEPDFVVETPDTIFMVEIKARKDMETPDVLEKSRAAKLYCTNVSEYTASTGGKKWEYSLIPHDEIKLDRDLKALIINNLAI